MVSTENIRVTLKQGFVSQLTRHHLAILKPPYLREILAGRKTIECRFGKIGNPPHRKLASSDLIWLKEVAGPVRGVVAVREVRSVFESGIGGHGWCSTGRWFPVNGSGRVGGDPIDSGGRRETARSRSRL